MLNSALLRWFTYNTSDVYLFKVVESAARPTYFYTRTTLELEYYGSLKSIYKNDYLIMPRFLRPGSYYANYQFVSIDFTTSGVGNYREAHDYSDPNLQLANSVSVSGGCIISTIKSGSGRSYSRQCKVNTVYLPSYQDYDLDDVVYHYFLASIGRLTLDADKSIIHFKYQCSHGSVEFVPKRISTISSRRMVLSGK